MSEGYKPSADEIVKNQTSRTLSDAEILERKEGEYVPGTEEGGEPRLEVTKKFIDGHAFNRGGVRGEMIVSISEQEKESREAVIERDSKIDLRELVKNNPELASKIECIDFIHSRPDIFIVKVKKFPEIGIIVGPVEEYRKDFHQHYGDGTMLHFNYTDEKSPKRTVFKSVESPVPGELLIVDGKKPWERGLEKDSPEIKKLTEEILEKLIEIAKEHSIKTMIIRQGDSWESYGFSKPPIDSFEIQDARWDETFEGLMGMPDFETHDHAHLSSKEGGYETDKEYPVFDWTRYH